MPSTRRPAVRRPGHNPVEEAVVPVIVADQRRTAGKDRRLRAAGQKGWRVPQRQRGARVGTVPSPPAMAVSRCHVGRSSGMCSSIRPPASPAVRAGARSIPPPLVEGRPRRGQVLAIRSPGSSSSNPRTVRDDSPAPRVPAPTGCPAAPAAVQSARGDTLKPGAPVRPVDVLYPPLPVLPARGNSHLTLAFSVLRHAASAAQMPPPKCPAQQCHRRRYPEPETLTRSVPDTDPGRPHPPESTRGTSRVY